jgi:uncharacterized protein YndB with AHSA1/START domain
VRALAPTDLAFFDDAPLRILARASLAAPPARVWAALADLASWPGWFPLMTTAAWTGATIARVGAEREVALRLLGRFRERMIAWEPERRFAFTMIASTSPMARRLAEDYRLAPDGGGGSTLDWVFAAEPTALGRLARPALVPMMRGIFARAGRRLEASLRA